MSDEDAEQRARAHGLVPTRFYCRSVAPGFAPTIFRSAYNPSYQEHLKTLEEGWECYLTIYAKPEQRWSERAVEPTD